MKKVEIRLHPSEEEESVEVQTNNVLPSPIEKENFPIPEPTPPNSESDLNLIHLPASYQMSKKN
jgi:hypothetical protein